MKRVCILLTALAIWAAGSAKETDSAWTGTWAAAAEFTGPSDMPKASLSNRSLREIVKVSIGGSSLRLQLSNEFSKEPVEIRSIYIADGSETWTIDTKTVRYLTFNGKRNVTIEPGMAIFSDVVKYNLKPLQRLAITINYGAQTPVNATSHRGSRTTSYIIEGMSKPKTSFDNGERADHWYNIASIDVLADEQTEAFGGQAAVLNLGIGGNCVLEGGLSEPALKRFDRDILGQRGVKTLIIFEGVNDIGWSNGQAESKSQRLIDAYKTLIEKARAKGMRVYMGTITPFKGNSYFKPFQEAARQVVNEWIRTTDLIDGVIDFDKAVRNENDIMQLKAEYSDDWLHLNPAGYMTMGKVAAEVLSTTK